MRQRWPYFFQTVAGVGLMILAAVLFTVQAWQSTGSSAGPALTSDDLANTRFGPVPSDPLTAPRLERIHLPHFPGANAVWGGTGRDSRGHIWFGVCAAGEQIPSAHLFEFDPASGVVADRGDVVSQLQQCGKYRAGEGQMKIHSKIVQATDGKLYFASMDEQGEHSDGSRLPTWGSHLWSIDPLTGRWQHLLSAPEALIAVAASGMHVYTLGYFDHVLYQYDCSSGSVRSVHVGAAGGHISRNFLVDHRDHVYVPRLREYTEPKSRLLTTLVEFDGSLREIAETAIEHYSQAKDDSSHGIVAVQPLADRSLVFATDHGFLYRIVPKTNAPADVEELGWFYPGGEAYVGSMFSYDGRRWLVGETRRNYPSGPRDEWLVFDLARRTSTVVPFPANGQLPNLLYGSMTRDDQGDMYLVGTADGVPLVFRARMPPP